jgi:hypothetical protein
VAGGDAVLIPLVYVTKLSGEALQRRLGGGVAIEHGRLGSSLIWFALGLFAAALLVVATRRRPGAPTLVANALAVLAAGAMVVWTVRVGDSGARAVWGGLVSNG